MTCWWFAVQLQHSRSVSTFEGSWSALRPDRGTKFHLTLGIGVVFSKTNVPVHRLHEVAENLAASAKRRFRRLYGGRTGICGGLGKPCTQQHGSMIRRRLAGAELGFVDQGTIGAFYPCGRYACWAMPCPLSRAYSGRPAVLRKRLGRSSGIWWINFTEVRRFRSLPSRNYRRRPERPSRMREFRRSGVAAVAGGHI